MDSGAPSSGFLPVRRHRESDLESLSAGSGSRRSFRFTPAHNSFLGISPLGATTPQFFAPPVLPFVNNAVSMPNHEVFQQTQGYSSGNNFSQANSSNPFHQFPAMDSSFPGHGHPFHFYHSNGSLGMVGYPAFQNSGFGQFSAPTLETNPPAAFNQMSNLSPSICKAEQKIVSQDIFSVSKSVEKSPSTIPLQLADNAASPGALQKTQSKTIKSDYESFLARYLQSESSGDDEDFVPTSDVSENESDDSSSAESSELDSNIPLKQHHHLFSNSFGQRTNERFLPNTKNDISPEEVQDVLQDARFSGISKSSSSRLVKLNDKELYRLRQQLADVIFFVYIFVYIFIY